MEFLVDMVTVVPEGTGEDEVAAVRAREAARSRQLAAEGSLLRLWRPPLAPGEWRTWGLFERARRRAVGDGARLDAAARLGATTPSHP